MTTTLNLDPEEIMMKVVEAAREVCSVQLESQATWEWREHRHRTAKLWVFVGGDYYSKSTFADPEDSYHEFLVYRGIMWKRGDEGNWVSDMPPGRDPYDTKSTDLAWPGMRDEQRMALIYAVDFQYAVTNLRRLADDVDLVRLQGRLRKEASFPAGALWPDQVGPDELDPPIDIEAQGTIDLWIDPERFRILRIDELLAPQADDSDGQTDAVVRLSTTVSRFNEAILPGPLPASPR
jgi:hypothetical protein